MGDEMSPTQIYKSSLCTINPGIASQNDALTPLYKLMLSVVRKFWP